MVANEFEATAQFIEKLEKEVDDLTNNLRDQFAGQALMGMRSVPGGSEPEVALRIANAAYTIADAMLEARKYIKAG